MNKYEKVAAQAFLKLVGEEWAKANAKKVMSTTGENADTVEVCFYLIAMLPTEEEALDPNYQSDGFISFIVNKKDLSCRVHRNLFCKEDVES